MFCQFDNCIGSLTYNILKFVVSNLSASQRWKQVQFSSCLFSHFECRAWLQLRVFLCQLPVLNKSSAWYWLCLHSFENSCVRSNFLWLLLFFLLALLNKCVFVTFHILSLLLLKEVDVPSLHKFIQSMLVEESRFSLRLQRHYSLLSRERRLLGQLLVLPSDSNRRHIFRPQYYVLLQDLPAFLVRLRSRLDLKLRRLVGKGCLVHLLRENSFLGHRVC